MAEAINEKRVEKLLDLALKMRAGQVDKGQIESLREECSQVTPQEVMEIEYRQLKQGVSATEMLTYVDKLLHLFHVGLRAYQWEIPGEETFLGTLQAENEALRNRMQEIKQLLKMKDLKTNRTALRDMVQGLMEIEKHYLKKENILFPYLEKKRDRFEGLSIMWALHDEARVSMKTVLESLDAGDMNSLHKDLGKMFFNLIGMTQKEEWILFPCAMQMLAEEDFGEMLRQSKEYGFAYIQAPEIEQLEAMLPEQDAWKGWSYRSDTGELSLEQLNLLLSHLPVDLTLVDENNKVQYFSKPKERFFPRSAASIGRDVSQCHPPQSVDKVLEIVEAFRRGEKDMARFWLRLRGRMVMIQYFALRDIDGTYKGVLEVSQDITEIKELDGERRLVDWGE